MTNTTVPQSFWEQITHQLQNIEEATTFEQIREILLNPAYDQVQLDINANGVRQFGPDQAFFDGTGGEATLAEHLRLAGWCLTSVRQFHYIARHPDTGQSFEYIEGDLERI